MFVEILVLDKTKKGIYLFKFANKRKIEFIRKIFELYKCNLYNGAKLKQISRK